MNEKFTEEVSQLKSALKRLKEALTLEPTQINKDGTIQRFEFTFELLWKTVKTYLATAGTVTKSPRDVFRAAADADIISDPEPYFQFLDKRNLASHTYSQSEADAVYEAIKDFPQAVQSILDNISS